MAITTKAQAQAAGWVFDNGDTFAEKRIDEASFIQERHENLAQLLVQIDARETFRTSRGLS